MPAITTYDLFLAASSTGAWSLYTALQAERDAGIWQKNDPLPDPVSHYGLHPLDAALVRLATSAPLHCSLVVADIADRVSGWMLVRARQNTKLRRAVLSTAALARQYSFAGTEDLHKQVTAAHALLARERDRLDDRQRSGPLTRQQANGFRALAALAEFCQKDGNDIGPAAMRVRQSVVKWATKERVPEATPSEQDWQWRHILSCVESVRRHYWASGVVERPVSPPPPPPPVSPTSANLSPGEPVPKADAATDDALVHSREAAVSTAADHPNGS